MAIARKPKSETVDEKAVEAVINKGGSVAATVNEPMKSVKDKQPVVLHIPSEWLEDIDKTLNTRRIKISRHTWLLEAVIEKLDREKN